MKYLVKITRMKYKYYYIFTNNIYSDNGYNIL
jgi:hypothetical protein